MRRSAHVAARKCLFPRFPVYIARGPGPYPLHRCVAGSVFVYLISGGGVREPAAQVADLAASPVAGRTWPGGKP